jgi:hypothetical protein
VRKPILLLTSCLAALGAGSAFAADPVKMTIKPLLCVMDKAATSCVMTFDIRWRSTLESEYCLNDDSKTAPLHCWSRARNGAHRERREVREEFVYWIGAPAGSERLAEVKISVLRVGSPDRRRERRTRHVWDVL